MIKINKDIEIHKYDHGWELHIWRDKMPMALHPNATGRARDVTYHGTVCQALMSAHDKMIDSDSDDIIASLLKASREIVDALGRSGIR